MKKYCGACGTELRDLALRATGTEDYFCLCGRISGKKSRMPCHMNYKIPKESNVVSFETVDLSDPELPTVVGEGPVIVKPVYIERKSPDMRA
jgi:hypothetical protein